MIIPIIVSARHIKTYTYEQLCFIKTKQKSKSNNYSSMASKPITIRWISQTEKACIASNYRQFSTNIKIKIIKLTLTKLVLILKFFILISAESCL